MSLLHLFLVAVIQGITEFLPVSSSGHLVLLPVLTGLKDQGQAIDVAVHIGTLVAVVVYFRSDVARIITGLGHLARLRMSAEAHLALCLIIATVPVVIAGLILKLTGLDEAMRSVAVIGWTMLIFGIVLYWADQRGATDRPAQAWSMRHAWIMGLWQAVALIPGTSRSGACITGARVLGYDRQGAARIAMLMSIPTILASGTLVGIGVASTADMQTAKDGAIAAVLSCLAALVALSLMMRLLRSVSYTPYVIYRVILGVVLLTYAYT
jgi:undecaprenyl-diphosphatase